MLRKATEQDIRPMAALRAGAFGETPAAAETWLREVAGLDNVLVLEQDAAVAAALALVPVRGAARRGFWLAMAVTAPEQRGQGLMRHLLRDVLRACAAGGYAFVAAAPPDESARVFLRRCGFADAFGLRLVEKSIPQNLLARADFDAMTVPELLACREHCQPRSILLPEPAMAGLITRLYRRGATVVSTQQSYGIYYTVNGNGCLYFPELEAENDRTADTLLQAVRERTGLVRAKLLLSEAQPLYMGLGKRRPYGMVCVLQPPLPVHEMDLRVY